MIAVKVLDSSGNGYASDVLAGLSWIRRQKERLGIRIVNISVGSYAGKYMSEDSALVRGVEAAWDDGLVVVVAAGNHGPANMSVTTPGISRKVITVGCSDDHKKVLVRGSVMVDYSGRGPTAACICKPEIIAPGAKVVSCTNRDGQYSMKSGTSMATPFVTGSAALIMQWGILEGNDSYAYGEKLKAYLLRGALPLLGEPMPSERTGWGKLCLRDSLE